MIEGQYIPVLAPHDHLHINQSRTSVSRALAALRRNTLGELPLPQPHSEDNPPGKWRVNRIRIAKSMALNYDAGKRMSDEEIRRMISQSTILFGWE